MNHMEAFARIYEAILPIMYYAGQQGFPLRVQQKDWYAIDIETSAHAASAIRLRFPDLELMADDGIVDQIPVVDLTDI